jgi:hypothetical protein
MKIIYQIVQNHNWGDDSTIGYTTIPDNIFIMIKKSLKKIYPEAKSITRTGNLHSLLEIYVTLEFENGETNEETFSIYSNQLEDTLLEDGD